MSAIRIRAFGLIPLSRRTYLIIQTCCFTILLAALAWVFLSPPDYARFDQLAASAEPSQQAPIRAFARLLEYAPMILLAAMFLGAIETLWMLRRFSRAAEAAKNAPREP